jgi:hypothetical protein
MGGTRSTYRVEETYIKDFGGESCEKELGIPGCRFDDNIKSGSSRSGM